MDYLSKASQVMYTKVIFAPYPCVQVAYIDMGVQLHMGYPIHVWDKICVWSITVLVEHRQNCSLCDKNINFAVEVE